MLGPRCRSQDFSPTKQVKSSWGFGGPAIRMSLQMPSRCVTRHFERVDLARKRSILNAGRSKAERTGEHAGERLFGLTHHSARMFQRTSAEDFAPLWFNTSRRFPSWTRSSIPTNWKLVIVACQIWLLSSDSTTVRWLTASPPRHTTQAACRSATVEWKRTAKWTENAWSNRLFTGPLSVLTTSRRTTLASQLRRSSSASTRTSTQCATASTDTLQFCRTMRANMTPSTIIVKGGLTPWRKSPTASVYKSSALE